MVLLKTNRGPLHFFLQNLTFFKCFLLFSHFSQIIQNYNLISVAEFQSIDGIPTSTLSNFLCPLCYVLFFMSTLGFERTKWTFKKKSKI